MVDLVKRPDPTPLFPAERELPHGTTPVASVNLHANFIEHVYRLHQPATRILLMISTLAPPTLVTALPSMCAEPSRATCLAQTWVVIPAHNEADRIHSVLSELKASGVKHIVVVDDGSGDATSAMAIRENVWVLQHIVNRGQGAALQTGIDFALSRGAKVIVTFDADGQHQASDVPTLLAPIDRGEAQVVLGSRFLGSAVGVPAMRKWLLKFAIIGTRLTTRLPLTDTHNGLRAMTATAAGKLRLTEDGMAHASELLDKLAESRLPWCEVPVTVRYTEQTLVKGQRNRAAFEILFRMLVAKLVG